MNPEIRFRVPKHVHELAESKANEYGLKRGKGRTGGASELARGALYTALGLSVPGDLHSLQQQAFEQVRQVRQGFSKQPGLLRVEVHHRVDPDYRKIKALKEQRAVAARATTVFEFEQGELPDFLVPYVVLTEDGFPYASLNLEGSLSPRRKALGELVCATTECSLDELQGWLKKHRAAQAEKQRRTEQLEQRKQKGEAILARWSENNGSPLLRARKSEGFEWLELASDEYARALLRDLGVDQALPVSTTTSLMEEQPAYDIRPQTQPGLESIERLKQLRQSGDDTIRFELVTYRKKSGQTAEAVQIALETPLPGRRYYLTEI